MQHDGNKERNRLIGSASVCTFVVIILALYGFYYIYPEYTTILENSASVNAQNLKYIAIEQDGLDLPELKKILEQNPAKQAETKLYFSSEDRLNAVIQKPKSEKKNYSDWLDSELWKKTQYEEEIQKNNAIIENIIPLFASQKISDFRNDTDQPVTGLITLRSFIRFVETGLLGKYSLQSYSPLGIGNIVFDDKEKNSDSIGSFVVNLDISWQNSNIKALINTIQSSGKITINKEGKLESITDMTNTNRLYSTLSNLLITIDDIKFSSDLSDDTKDNKGNITLRFYVRGIGKAELITINENLLSRYTTLVKILNDTLDCSKLKPQVCANSFGARAVSTLQALQRDVGGIKIQADELKKSSGTIELDLNKAFQFQASLNAIEKKEGWLFSFE